MIRSITSHQRLFNTELKQKWLCNISTMSKFSQFAFKELINLEKSLLPLHPKLAKLLHSTSNKNIIKCWEKIRKLNIDPYILEIDVDENVPTKKNKSANKKSSQDLRYDSD